MIQRALAVLLLGAVVAAAGAPPSKEVARVNGVAIARSELEALMKRLGPTPGASAAQRRQEQAEMLGMLVEKELMRQFLDRDKSIPAVDAAEIDRRLKEMAKGLKAQGKSVEEFCHETHQSAEQFRAAIATHVRWSRYLKAHAKEEQLRAYYQKNKDVFDGVTVRASHIVFRLPRGAKADEIAKARARLEQLRDRIVRDKDDFAEMARQYSHEPRAKTTGGALAAPLSRKWDFDEPFAKAAFALKVGEVSEVVQTEYGLHLIKVTARSPGKPTDFAAARAEVAERFAEDLRQEVLTAERKKAKIEVFLD